MLKKICSLLTLLSPFIIANAQVQIHQLTVAEALSKAAAENKIAVFVIPNAACSPCYEMIMKAFESPGLGRSYNSSAVTVVAAPGSAVRKNLDSAYGTANAMGLLFVNADGNLLNRFYSATTMTLAYAEQLDKALKKKENPDLAYTQYLRDYQEGKRDFNLLYALVAKKNDAQLVHDELTSEMLISAPRDSARSISFLQFVAEQAPVIGSTADAYLRKNVQLFNDAWYTMPLQKRITINRTLIEKSKQKAIKEHDINYARRVAAFTANTYNDQVSSMKALDKTMIDYYKGVADTVSFLLATCNFYDRYLMTISVDSTARLDSVRRKEFIDISMPAAIGRMSVTAISSGPIAVANPKNVAGDIFALPAARFVPIASEYSSDLNNGAWSLYTVTNDIAYTAKALEWAKRAIEFSDAAPAMDTYARLLYRSGHTKAAIEWEEKAIARNKQYGLLAGEYERILAKMKKGAVPLDEY